MLAPCTFLRGASATDTRLDGDSGSLIPNGVDARKRDWLLGTGLGSPRRGRVYTNTITITILYFVFV